MNFGQSVSTCLRKYADFAGRGPRPEFWWFYLFQVLAYVVVAMVSSTLASVVALALLLPSLAAGARRLHDIDRTGWWQLLLLTGLGFFVLLYWWVQPSQPEPNRFGGNALAPTEMATQVTPGQQP